MLYNYDARLIEDFLQWVGKEHGGVLTDITKPDINNRTNYKFLSHPKLIEEYINSKEEGYAYD